MAAIVRYDATSDQFMTISAAVQTWKRSVHGPARFIRFREDDCGQPECCRIHLVARDILDDAIRRLPARTARDLQQLIAPYDAEFLRRSLPDPMANADRPWWPGASYRDADMCMSRKQRF